MYSNLYSIKKYNNKNKESIEHLPALYKETQSVSKVAEEIWPLIYQQVFPLVNDVDVVSDFCLYFYERIPKCFEVFEKSVGVPFYPFLITYSKNLLKNFLRYHKRRRLEQDLLLEYYNLQHPGSYLATNHHEESCDNYLNEELYNPIAKLDIKYRTVIKLYLGIDLLVDELKYLLMDLLIKPSTLSEFLSERRVRKDKHSSLLHKYRDRSSHLQSLLLRSTTNEQREKLLHKKHRIKNMLDKRLKLKEMTHVARLLKVNKSTISRYLYQASALLSKMDDLL